MNNHDTIMIGDSLSCSHNSPPRPTGSSNVTVQQQSSNDIIDSDGINIKKKKYLMKKKVKKPLFNVAADDDAESQ